MKNSVLFAASLLLFFTSCKKDDDKNEPTKVTYKTLSGNQPLVIGHRGASGVLPEHTIESYTRAIEDGADFIEPDLVMTKDSVLIARHEPMLSGTTNIKDVAAFASRKSKKMVDGIETEDWFASDFTLAEIKTLKAIQPVASRPQEYNNLFSIPTFEEVVTLAKTKSSQIGRTVGVYPETKHPTFHENLKLRITDKLLDALTKAGWNNAESPVFVQSFEVSNLQYINTKSTVRLVQLLDAYGVNADGTMDMTAPYGQPYDFVVSGNSNTYNYFITDAGLDFVKTYADGIGPWKPYIVPVYENKILKTNDLIERAHKKGLLVHAYTFRDESNRLAADYLNNPQAEYKKFYDLGIDGVFTDFPVTAVAARK